MIATFEPQGIMRCEGCNHWMSHFFCDSIAPPRQVYTCYQQQCPNVGKIFEMPTIELKEIIT